MLPVSFLGNLNTMKRSDLPQFSELRLGEEFYVPTGKGALFPSTPKDGPFTKFSVTSYIASPTAMNPAGGKVHSATATLHVWPTGTSRDVADIKRERGTPGYISSPSRDLASIKQERGAGAKSDGQKRGERRYRDAKARLREKLGREPTTLEMARSVQKRMLARKT